MSDSRWETPLQQAGGAFKVQVQSEHRFSQTWVNSFKKDYFGLDINYVIKKKEKSISSHINHL